MGLLGLIAALAASEPVVTASQAQQAVEVIVVEDPFLRWRDTRWRVDTQLQLPYPMPLYAEVNQELWVVAVDLRLVLHCDLEDDRRPRQRDVRCDVEDAAISVAPWMRSPRAADAVLAETDARLQDLAVSLRVGADGTVDNVTLLGEPEQNRRVSILYENLRQLVRRAVIGFHMSSPERVAVGSTWIERASPAFSLPTFRTRPTGWGVEGLYGAPTVAGLQGETFSPESNRLVPTPLAPLDTPSSALTRGGQLLHPFDLYQAQSSVGQAVIAHKLDAFRGRHLVQSRGEGTVDLGLEQPVTFRGTLDAVAVLDPTGGVMTEHVWRLDLTPTAGSIYADGVQGWPFWQLGRLRQLGRDEASEVGASAIVDPPRIDRGQLPPFPSLM